MLGMLINTNMPGAPNAWKIWIDHVMKHSATYGFKKSALIQFNGATQSATSGFSLHPQEILNLRFYFESKTDRESVRLQGKTFIVKSIDSHQMVAFNGSKYFIINRSKSMYLVVLCDSKAKCDDGSLWLAKLTNKLIEKGF